MRYGVKGSRKEGGKEKVREEETIEGGEIKERGKE